MVFSMDHIGHHPAPSFGYIRPVDGGKRQPIFHRDGATASNLLSPGSATSEAVPNRCRKPETDAKLIDYCFV